MTPTTIGLLLATLAAAPPTAGATGAGLAAATVSAERLALPPGAGGPVRLDALGASLVIPSRRPAHTARALSGKSGLCPTVEPLRDGVRLRCRTRRLAATVLADRRGPVLELREVRGIPWRPGPDGPPLLPWDPVALGASPCPGATPAVRGECAFARGDHAAATRHFLDATSGPEAGWAAVRLGDLALAEDRLEEAIGWWKAAGTTGRFARLAIARLGELTGKGLEGPVFAARFDPAGLPWPVDLELVLRAMRVEAFLDRPASAAARLLALDPGTRAAACTWAEPLCRRIVLAALDAAEGPDREAALALYLSLPDYHRGPLAVELARSAAEVAAALGAEIFAGNLLSTAAAAVPPGDLAPHLLRAAELFLAGADPVRAAVILEYARTRLPARELRAPRWRAIVTAVTATAATPATPAAPAPDSGSAPPDPDLERARRILEHARGS